MTFVREVMRDKPVALYSLETASPFPDLSGYGRAGTHTGTAPAKGISLLAGLASSAIFDRLSGGKFESPMFKSGGEQSPFTLEATVRTINNTTGQMPQAYKENLARNPSFSHAATITALGNIYTGTRTMDNTVFLNGTQSLKFAKDAANPSNAICGQYVATTAYGSLFMSPVTPGKFYSSGAWVRTNVASLVRIAPGARNSAGGGGTNIVPGPLISVPANLWTWITYENFEIVGTDTTHLGTRVEAFLPGGAISTGTEITWVDSWMLNEGPTVNPYFDGSKPGYEWMGTAHESFSRTASNVSRVNLATAPSMELAGTGAWTNNVAMSVITADTTYYRHAVRSVRATRVESTNSVTTLASAYCIGYGGAGVYGGIVPGETLTFSVYLRPSVGGKYNAIPSIYWYNSAGAPIGPSTGPTLTAMPISWENRATVTAVVPAGATGYRTMINVLANTGVATTGDFVNLDCALVEKANTAGEYFDGSTSGAMWSGTENNSPSYMLVSNSEQQVLGNLNQMDGLTVNGTNVSFVTKYNGASEARVTYDLQQPRTVQLHGVYNGSKNSLYVNGELVGEVDLTPEQLASNFAAPDGFLYSGTTGSSQAICVNGVGVYASALEQNTIMRHYLAGTALPTGEQVPVLYGGHRIPLSLDNGNLFLDQWWTSEEHWKAASLFNVAVVDGQLRPQFVDDTSVVGIWMDSFALEAAEGTSIYGVSANWDGKGVVIDASLDGDNWETVERGKNIALVPPGFNPTDKELQIRVTFPGGILNDTAFLDNLNFVGIKSGVTPAVNGRTLTFVNSYQERDYRPLELHENWGAYVSTNGTITISVDQLEATPVRTIEVWIKADATSPSVNFGTGAATGLYQNGVAGTSILPGQQWVVYHRLLTADHTGTVILNVPGQVGQVVLYPTALTTAQIAKIYGQYVGTDILAVNDSGVWSVTQTSPAARIYGFDWTIQPAG